MEAEEGTLTLNIVSNPAPGEKAHKNDVGSNARSGSKRDNKHERRRRRHQKKVKKELGHQEEQATQETLKVRSVEAVEEAVPQTYQSAGRVLHSKKPSTEGANKTSDHNNNDDYEERARYLAEFHARPLELDRRNRAIRVAPDKNDAEDSNHLFTESSSWSELSDFLHPRIVQAMESPSLFALKQPTLIQARTIPVFFKEQTTERNNILMHSETGSGKTLAYLLPILQSLAVAAPPSRESRQQNRAKFGTRCLILCPTRELAAQTYSVVERLCTHTFHWIVPGSLLGGASGATTNSRKSEKTRLRKGLAVVVATPGRLLDHLCKTESLLMALKGRLEWIVMDECDRLLDMGLGAQVKQIYQRLLANHAGGNSSDSSQSSVPWRSILVSATVTPSVQELATEALVAGNQSWIWVKGSNSNTIRGMARNEKCSESTSTNEIANDISGKDELADSTPQQLAQWCITVNAKLRLPTLLAFLVHRIQQKQRTVIFMDTCSSVDFHYALFQSMESIFESNDNEDDYGEDVSPSGIFGNSCDVFKLHGSVPHQQRQIAISQFLRPSLPSSRKRMQGGSSDSRLKPEKSAVLLATDVAARGLNLQGCEWVVQYDPPSEISDYVHRSGRVARAGRSGNSLLFLLPSEREFLSVLKKRGVPKLTALSLASTLGAAAKICPSLSKEGVAKTGGSLASSSRLGEAFSLELQHRMEECVLQNDGNQTEKGDNASSYSNQKKKRGNAVSSMSLSDMARIAFQSHVRAYPTREKLVRHIFSAKALHLGHIARSFALRETPTKSGKRAPKELEKDPSSDKKRNAAMAFRAYGEEDDDNETNSKDFRKHSKKSKRSINPKEARLMMLANAEKLHGMDA